MILLDDAEKKNVILKKIRAGSLHENAFIPNLRVSHASITGKAPEILPLNILLNQITAFLPALH